MEDQIEQSVKEAETNYDRSHDGIKNVCNEVVEIDTTEFKSNFIAGDPIPPTKRYPKVNGTLTIQTGNSAYTFTDNDDHGDYDPRYIVVGEDTNKNWIWVLEQGLHTGRYLLINTKTSRIDTLVGTVRIQGDIIVSLQDDNTDSPRIVEIYKIKGDRIIPINKFSLQPCERLCCVRTIYLKGNIIYIAANDFKEWRAWKAEVF